MEVIAVFVAGEPVAQGSMTAFVVGGRAVITDQKRKALKPWRSAIAAAVTAAGERFEDRPVAVSLGFVFVRPKSVKRRLPSVRPDADKCARAALDALTESGCIKDDSQVVDLQVSKRYGVLPGVQVEVRLADGEGEQA